MTAALRAIATRLRQVDAGRLAEWLVLAGVLAIAALISYTHLRTVWQTVAAPWADIGPLTVDGLFAAAWLRTTRRRRAGQAVSKLAGATLLGALLVTVAGNVAAAFPAWVTAQRDYVAPVVYAWAAIAFAFVFELIVGRARQVFASPIPARTAPDGPGTDLAEHTEGDASDWPDRSELLEQSGDQSALADEHLAAVQALADEIGRRPTRQAVRDLTGVGATRADRLRTAVRVRTTTAPVRPVHLVQEEATS